MEKWVPAGMGGGWAEVGERCQTVSIHMTFMLEGTDRLSEANPRCKDVVVAEKVDLLRDKDHLKEIEQRLVNALHAVVTMFYPECDLSTYSDWVKPGPAGTWERMWFGERDCQGCNSWLPLKTNGEVGRCPNRKCPTRSE